MLWVTAFAAAVTVYILSHVDNWRRDFTTNQASTEGPEADLPPMIVPESVEATQALLRRAIADLRHWQEQPATAAEPVPAEPDGTVRLYFVRSTRLLRFKDDVTIRLEPAADDSTVVHVQSRSRIGRGDLGQNPRNIRELFEAMGKK